MRTLLPIVLSAALMLTVFLLVTFSRPASEHSEEFATLNPIADVSATVSLAADNLMDGRLELYNKTGAVVEVTGAFGPADITELSDDLQLLFESADVTEAEAYDIYYEEVGGLLLVTLYGESLETSRAQAVKKIEEKLGVTVPELCDLNVSVITDVETSGVYRGIELGVPGCSDALTLP